MGTGIEVITAAFIATFIAQLLKFIFYYSKHKAINFKIFASTGGMPSSHSAAVVSTMTSVGLIEGFDSVIFSVALVSGLIVMYDAAGLRRSAGQMATQLNMLVDALYEQRPHSFRNKLIELLGHTPLEVTMGALLGIAMSILIHYTFLLG
ncbi:MAG: divergent PAP2 family protein [bacterium]|nr:divergent PAP2 family protein [bacterium]